MKILVLGASGQLGNCLKKVAAERQILDISFPGETDANILDEALLNALFQKESPQFIINCAAYTAVDKAEEDIDICRKVNRDGAELVAILCARYNATLIHISTDFVFEGNTPQLLMEDDITTPISIYGLTKLEGEDAIKLALPAHVIIRTSWLYSEFGGNFVKTMLRLGREREQLGVIIDQIGSPTYAIDLAGTILNIIEATKPAYGIYHYSNEGITSWYDFAKAIFALSDIKVRVNPLKTSEYVTKAARPAYSAMDKRKIKQTFNIEIPYWRDSLTKCIERLAQE